jgi:thiamine pyrophosphate-dependent acetolactate synthase large subunit-like protein
MAQGLGCHGEIVEQPEGIRPTLERAQVDDGMVAFVNVKTGYAPAPPRSASPTT